MNLPLSVEAQTLHQHLDDPQVLVIDLSSEENYLAGHIPGAIHLAPSRLLNGEKPVPNTVPTKEKLAALYNELGITPDTWVVAYDDQKGPWAGRFMWTLNILGHQNCSVLNGQFDAWKQAGLAIEQQKNQPSPSNHEINYDDCLLADADYILSHLDDANCTIWDARSAAEYSGEKVINAQKGGHIPGAKHFEWTDCLISDSDLRLKPKEELLSLLAEAGINPDNTIITHCQTHRRSGLTYWVAKHLGFENIRCYDGSWFEWGNLPNTPVEK
ncbi:sulfurtransferase [Neptuniibacter sp. PT8_73]|uniref:sulfurtransferase n=1 Tax=unclassified Neptuniibacter TaxID=2630693 RepID=UPI0039F72528